VEPEIARLLAEGRVVARFNGRMEFGPARWGIAPSSITPATIP
jgi:predicted NodU family carbamoyl transferase